MAACSLHALRCTLRVASSFAYARPRAETRAARAAARATKNNPGLNKFLSRPDLAKWHTALCRAPRKKTRASRAILRPRTTEVGGSLSRHPLSQSHDSRQTHTPPRAEATHNTTIHPHRSRFSSYRQIALTPNATHLYGYRQRCACTLLSPNVRCDGMQGAGPASLDLERAYSTRSAYSTLNWKRDYTPGGARAGVRPTRLLPPSTEPTKAKVPAAPRPPHAESPRARVRGRPRRHTHHCSATTASPPPARAPEATRVQSCYFQSDEEVAHGASECGDEG